MYNKATKKTQCSLGISVMYVYMWKREHTIQSAQLNYDLIYEWSKTTTTNCDHCSKNGCILKLFPHFICDGLEKPQHARHGL
jgi:hypothetical protein